jgi:hypothetical protein
MQILQQKHWSHSHGSHLSVHGCLMLLSLLPGSMQFKIAFLKHEIVPFFTPLYMFFISSLIWMIEDVVAYIYDFALLPSLPALLTSCQYCSAESHAPQWTTNLTSGIFTPKPKATVQIMNMMVDSSLTKFWIILFWSLLQRPAWNVPISLFSKCFSLLK